MCTSSDAGQTWGAAIRRVQWMLFRQPKYHTADYNRHSSLQQPLLEPSCTYTHTHIYIELHCSYSTFSHSRFSIILHPAYKSLNIQIVPVGGANKGFPLGNGGSYLGCYTKVSWKIIRINLDKLQNVLFAMY